MKSLKLPLAILLLCLTVAAAGAGYWYWLKTPQYSMLKLAEAVRNHDGPSFRNYFDVENVASNAISDLTAEELQEVGGPQLLRRFLGIAILGIVKPQATETLAKGINNYVEKTPEQAAGDSAAQKQSPDDKEKRQGALEKVVEGFVNKVVEAIKPPSLREILADMELTSQNYRGLTDFETSGQLSHVGLIFSPAKKDKITVMLELENANDHWRVIRISNMGVLARILTASTPP